MVSSALAAILLLAILPSLTMRRVPLAQKVVARKPRSLR
jgi:hypothetical protein